MWFNYFCRFCDRKCQFYSSDSYIQSYYWTRFEEIWNEMICKWIHSVWLALYFLCLASFLALNWANDLDDCHFFLRVWNSVLTCILSRFYLIGRWTHSNVHLSQDSIWWHDFFLSHVCLLKKNSQCYYLLVCLHVRSKRNDIIFHWISYCKEHNK